LIYQVENITGLEAKFRKNELHNIAWSRALDQDIVSNSWMVPLEPFFDRFFY
jgi:hypothetical protein